MCNYIVHLRSRTTPLPASRKHLSAIMLRERFFLDRSLLGLPIILVTYKCSTLKGYKTTLWLRYKQNRYSTLKGYKTILWLRYKQNKYSTLKGYAKLMCVFLREESKSRCIENSISHLIKPTTNENMFYSLHVPYKGSE